MRISDWSSDVCSSDLECGNISDAPLCSICTSAKRDRSLICVVEDSRDVMAIENTQQYNGLYHVLGGLISPMDGVGPSDLNIPPLVERAANGVTAEIILALNATMERSEEHTSELQSLMRISYAVFCLKKKTNIIVTS